MIVWHGDLQHFQFYRFEFIILENLELRCGTTDSRRIIKKLHRHENREEKTIEYECGFIDQ